MNLFSTEKDFAHVSSRYAVAAELGIQKDQSQSSPLGDLIQEIFQNRADLRRISDAFIDVPWQLSLHKYSLEEEHTSGVSNLIISPYSALQKSVLEGSQLVRGFRAYAPLGLSNRESEDLYGSSTDLEAKMSRLLTRFEPTPRESLRRVMSGRSTQVRTSMSLMSRQLIDINIAYERMASGLEYLLLPKLFNESTPSPAHRIADTSRARQAGSEVEGLSVTEMGLPPARTLSEQSGPTPQQVTLRSSVVEAQVEFISGGNVTVSFEQAEVGWVEMDVPGSHAPKGIAEGDSFDLNLFLGPGGVVKGYAVPKDAKPLPPRQPSASEKITPPPPDNFDDPVQLRAYRQALRQVFGGPEQ